MYALPATPVRTRASHLAGAQAGMLHEFFGEQADGGGSRPARADAVRAAPARAFVPCA